MSMNDVLRGVVTGVLIGFILLYSLRPKMPYPSWILITYEYPWMFVLLIGVAVWCAMWDRVVGALCFVAIIPIVADYYMLGKKPIVAPGANVASQPKGVAPIDAEGPPLFDIDIAEERDYPMFNDAIESVQPGEPSPF